MAQFAVIGLGVFGRTTALELTRLGNAVIGIDNDPKLVEDIKDDLTYTVIVDATDADALAELNLTHCHAVLVAIGENLEASLLCVLALQTLGVQNLWVKAKTDAHHAILQRMNITRIIHPEQEMGLRIAHNMNYPLVQQYMSLGDQQYLVKLYLPDHCAGMSLAELLRDFSELTIYAIKRGDRLIRDFSPGLILQQLDRLVIAGLVDQLQGFTRVLQRH